MTWSPKTYCILLMVPNWEKSIFLWNKVASSCPKKNRTCPYNTPSLIDRQIETDAFWFHIPPHTHTCPPKNSFRVSYDYILLVFAFVSTPWGSVKSSALGLSTALYAACDCRAWAWAGANRKRPTTSWSRVWAMRTRTWASSTWCAATPWAPLPRCTVTVRHLGVDYPSTHGSTWLWLLSLQGAWCW